LSDTRRTRKRCGKVRRRVNSPGLWLKLLTDFKFWKQFFEASANVSLSNYAEPAIDDSSVNPDAEGSRIEGESETEQTAYTSPSHTLDDDEGDLTITTPGTQKRHESEDEDDPLLTSPSMPHNHSTPRMPGSATGKQRAGRDVTATKVADQPSPYEALRREMRGDKGAASKATPITPGKRPPALPDMSMTPGSSPFAIPPESAFKTAGNKDTILHQGILGKNYRVAATPMTARRTHVLDTTMSSPDEPEPQLRAEIFSSPVKPGYSVQTPGRKEAVERHRAERRRSSKAADQPRELDFGEATRGRSGFTSRSVLNWDSEDEELPEMSPPKTMHFHLGEMKLIQTPGSYFIDLLLAIADQKQRAKQASASWKTYSFLPAGTSMLSLKSIALQLSSKAMSFKMRRFENAVMSIMHI
jgi:DASH complex subunit ASK1